MITKETFYEAMHRALKASGMKKLAREKLIDRRWHDVTVGGLCADTIIEHEESMTREYIKAKKKPKPYQRKTKSRKPL